MSARQGGAALLALMTILVATAAVAGTLALQRLARSDTTQRSEQHQLALAAEALRGHAFRLHCLAPITPANTLLPCPNSAGADGVAAASCPGTTRGWLPWATLGVPPLRDTSGTCLWYERSGTTARVIAPGAARAGQNRTSLPARVLCNGNYTSGNYLDAADASQTVTLNLALLSARCP
jgi:hypothetical protein